MPGGTLTRIAVVSHSLVAERQRWFFDYLGRGDPDLQELQVGPRDWGVHHNPRGYLVEGQDDMAHYRLGPEALKDIEAFVPDILLVQNEAYCAVTTQMRRAARRLGARFVIFAWENINPYSGDDHAVENLKGADLVVCGNSAARRLVEPYNPKTELCIQVGVNPEIFAPNGKAKDHDVIFQGRMSPEKGYEVLRQAIQGTEWKVLWPEKDFGTPYNLLGDRYNRARVHASPSMDTQFWREQHSAYANLEALFCGLYIATSDSDAIVEGLQGCPGVYFTKQGNAVDLRNAIERFLEKSKEVPVNEEGRSWAVHRYGYKALAATLLEAFRRL